MSVSQATVNVYFSNGTSQVYTLDATDGTEGALLELVSGGEIGTAAQNMVPVAIQATCENQFEYVTLLDELAVMQWTSGGCNSEAVQGMPQEVPPRTVGLNWSLKVLTAAS
jgi:hypothetical protein